MKHQEGFLGTQKFSGTKWHFQEVFSGTLSRISEVQISLSVAFKMLWIRSVLWDTFQCISSLVRISSLRRQCMQDLSSKLSKFIQFLFPVGLLNAQSRTWLALKASGLFTPCFSSHLLCPLQTLTNASKGLFREEPLWGAAISPFGLLGSSFCYRLTRQVFEDQLWLKTQGLKAKESWERIQFTPEGASVICFVGRWHPISSTHMA